MTRTFISAIALTTAMLLSGGAMAQTMVGGASVSAEDLPKVQSACDTLAAKEGVDNSAASEPSSTNETADATSGDTDAGLNATTTTSIDLALLTYESCKEAGLVK